MTDTTVHDDRERFLKLGSLLKNFPQDEDFAAFKTVSHEDVPAMRSEIRQRAGRIFENWETLESIVKRHEATIQNRWTKKSNMKRRDLLLTAWPNMPRDHRPDIDLSIKAYGPNGIRKVGGEPRGKPRKQYEGPQREALLMPYINLQDLTKREPLLLMINARARHPPHAFSKRDLQLSTPNGDLIEWCALEGYVMDFDGRESVPEGYGELREGKWKAVAPITGADPRLAGGTINPGDGLWILEIQDRIYKFLLDTVLRILHDIPTQDLTGPKYAVQPEPRLPSANYREDGIVSLASTSLEAIYSSPGNMDLHRLQLLVAAKANEEEDNLWDMREDPGCFSEGLADYLAHQPEYVSDLSGTKHFTTTVDGCRATWGPDVRNLEEVLSTAFLLSIFLSVEFWGGLAQDITDLVKLKKKHFDSGNIKPGERLPEPFEMALYKLQRILCDCIRKRLTILRKVAFSSPPLRPFIRRALPDTLKHFVPSLDKKPPRHVEDFVFILHHLFFGKAVEVVGHVAGVQSLLEQYDKFITTIPDAHQAVSPLVAREISYLSLLSECLRQIHLFQPWAATSHQWLESPRIEGIIQAHFDNKTRGTVSLETLWSSARVRSIVSDIAQSPYPAHKKRTAANVDAMQNAETLLDQMWESMLAGMEQGGGLPTYSKNVLFFQGRQLERTPDWVEPVKPTKTTPQAGPQNALVRPFGGLDIHDTRKERGSPIEKSKTKTRGTAAPQIPAPAPIQNTVEQDQIPAHTIQVDRRAFKVFNTIFHTPSSKSRPGEVPWTEFLHAMRSVGFSMEKLYGSVWQFTPDASNNSSLAAGMRSILFHEPHPQSRIPFWDARRHGRRLTRVYGWSGETFVLK